MISLNTREVPRLHALLRLQRLPMLCRQHERMRAGCGGSAAFCVECWRASCVTRHAELWSPGRASGTTKRGWKVASEQRDIKQPKTNTSPQTRSQMHKAMLLRPDLAVDVIVHGGGLQRGAAVHELGAVLRQVRPQRTHVRTPVDVPHRARAAVPAPSHPVPLGSTGVLSQFWIWHAARSAARQ